MKLRLSKSVETITERTLPVGALRVGIAVMSAALATLVVRIDLTASWLGLALSAEIWTWLATVPQRTRRPASDAERLNYFVSIIYMNIVWCGLAVLVWMQPFVPAQMAAVMLLAAQLVHAQAFAAFSAPMLFVVGGLPAATLAGFAFATARINSGHTVLLVGATTLLISYTVVASLMNRARERSLVAARNAADDANRTKTLYMNLLSHEMRTPLTGLLGMLEAIKLKAADASKDANVSIMDEAARNMMCLLDDMLDAAKQEAGTLEIQTAVVDLDGLLASLGRLWQAKAEEKGIQLRIARDDTVPARIRGDRQRLLQVLNNLVANALKFTTQGSVDVRVTATDGRLVMSVVDTGPGISSGTQHHLFQPFSQGGSADSRRAGAGLGLYVCRRLCEGMKGSITVSTAVEGGAVFTISLPLLEVTEAATEAPVEARVIAGLSVLVIDDHPANQLVMKTMLNALGCRACTAGTAADALMHASNELFDIVLLDLHLADCDGRDLLADLMQRGLLKSGARAIAFTADLASDTLAGLSGAGFHSVLSKPVVAQNLVAALASA